MLNLILIFIVLILASLTFLFIRAKLNRESIHGKLALVTGGSNGLGQQICIQLAKNGCNVMIADIAPADVTIKQLEKYDIKCKAYRVDVSNYEEIERLKSSVCREFGNVDILVNNAGLIAYKTMQEQTSSEIERLYKVNVNSVALMTKCFIERMVETGRGHVVTISSLQGIYPFPYSINYAATKFAVTGFMQSLKEYLRRENLNQISTTCIFPHVIATREDVVNAVNHDLCEVLKAEKCGEDIVDAIIHKRSFVTIPEYYGFIIPIFNLLPFFAQHIIRDYFRREHLFMAEKKKN